MTIEESTGEVGLFVTSARYLIRETGVACLGTLESGTGNPYASLITVATETGGAPVFLISRLAWHTRNLEADPRASILCMSEKQPGDPLALGRVSLMGIAEKTDNILNPAVFSRGIRKPGAMPASPISQAFPQSVEDVNQVPDVLRRLASGEATSS